MSENAGISHKNEEIIKRLEKSNAQLRKRLKLQAEAYRIKAYEESRAEVGPFTALKVLVVATVLGVLLFCCTCAWVVRSKTVK